MLSIRLPSPAEFHFERPPARGWKWGLIVGVVLNFAVVIGAVVALVRFFHA